MTWVKTKKKGKKKKMNSPPLMGRKVGQPSLQFRKVKVSKIKLRPDQEDAVRYNVANGIAETYAVTSGPIHPVTVRVIEDGLLELVTGVQRLHAAKIAGQEYIDCFVFEGGETQAKLVPLIEDIFRKRLSVLREAEKTAEFVKLASRLFIFSGQVGQKSIVGRPTGGRAKIARELAAFGRSPEARRKHFQRCERIAKITPEAKTAIGEGRLQNNQKALLAIAGASGPEAQVRAAKKLAERARQIVPPTKADGLAVERAKEPRITGDEPPAGNEDVDDGTDGPAKALPEPNEPTSITMLRKAWNRELKKLWAYTPMDVRDEFVTMLRRAPCRARGDIEHFLRAIFSGRKRIECKTLYAYGRAKGFSQAIIRQILKIKGYKRVKRRGDGNRGPWQFKNIAPHPENGIKVIKDHEINATLMSWKPKVDEVDLLLAKSDPYYET